MPRLSSALWSSIGKKLFTGLTGVGLIIFIIEHLAGNLLLLHPDPEPFNQYAHFLHSLGELLYLLEFGLFAVFIIHIISGISVFFGKRKARPERYEQTANAGKPSRKSLSSSTMIYTGLVLLIFLIVHLIMFRFGPGVEAGYVDEHLKEIHGEDVRDLYTLVMEAFSNPGVVIGYVAVMLFLGFHLRHGFWSAFQSIGINHPRYTSFIYAFGIGFAIVMAVGFLILPIWIYVREVVL